MALWQRTPAVTGLGRVRQGSGSQERRGDEIPARRWLEAAEVRRSRRSYTDESLSGPAADALEHFCRTFTPFEGARTVLVREAPGRIFRAGCCTSTVRCLRPRPWCLLEIAACPMRRPVPDTQARLPCWRPPPLISPPAGLEAACGGARWKSCSDCRTTSTSTPSPSLATPRTGSLRGSASPRGWRRLGPESRLRPLLRV